MPIPVRSAVLPFPKTSHAKPILGPICGRGVLKKLVSYCWTPENGLPENDSGSKVPCRTYGYTLPVIGLMAAFWPPTNAGNKSVPDFAALYADPEKIPSCAPTE